MVHQNEAPVHATPENIGKVVIIQTIERDGDELDLDSLVKVVGILESFVCSKNGFAFKLKGNAAYDTVRYEDKVVEIYLP